MNIILEEKEGTFDIRYWNKSEVANNISNIYCPIVVYFIPNNKIKLTEKECITITEKHIYELKLIIKNITTSYKIFYDKYELLPNLHFTGFTLYNEFAKQIVISASMNVCWLKQEFISPTLSPIHTY